MEFAPNCAAYYPFGVDVFLSHRKINHIARFVHLPALNLSEEAPSVLVRLISNGMEGSKGLFADNITLS
ncbi:hypothetical protein SLEP1_g20234 [Rubroshorea leprosula]|uniref:Uncharacterized protein n=1 Tax=Rubroshorea leprosula TaxID=152421 RepID=A0AAV5J9L0_9ROSI|nr:hypothetical protein SLEP1_g20234 [Rubroshorea leprosula]